MVTFPQGVTTETLFAGDLFFNETARDKEQIVSLMEKLRMVTRVRKDYVIPAKRLFTVVTDEGDDYLASLQIDDVSMQRFTMRDIAHEQLGGILKIPRDYYRRMLEGGHYNLLATNTNHWLARHDRNLLVRTVGDYLQAVLSDMYLPLSNVMLFNQAFAVSKDMGAEIIRAQASERQFYLAMVKPEWATQVEQRGPYTITSPGQVVPIVTAVNSETGHSGLNIDIGLYEMTCCNNNVWIRQLARVHRGARFDVGFISEETRKLELQVVWSTVKDAITAAFDKTVFDQMVEAMSAGTAVVIDDAVETVKQLASDYTLSEDEQDSILNAFASPQATDYGPTATGMMSAISFVGNQKDGDPDRMSELSRIAGTYLKQATRELVPA